MIDTVTLSIKLPLNDQVTRALAFNELPDWDSSSRDKIIRRNNEKRSQYFATHEDSGMRVKILNGSLESVQISLPRLIHGNNAIQLREEADLSAAMQAVRVVLAPMIHPFLLPHWPLTRLDLALTLRLDPRPALASHRLLRHPLIRKETECWSNEDGDSAPGRSKSGRRSFQPPHVLSDLNTVRYKGTNTVIVLYDKSSEMKSRKEGIQVDHDCGLRVEVQLKTAKHIARFLGSEGATKVRFDELSVEKCYRVFREIMIQFDPVNPFPCFKPKIESLLAILERHPETWASIGNVCPLDWYRASKRVTDRQFKEMRRKVAKFNPTFSGFRWADFLPEDRLPDLVDIDNDGQACVIQDLPQFG